MKKLILLLILLLIFTFGCTEIAGLVVTGTLMDISSNASGVNEQTALAKWREATPIAITDYGFQNSDFIVVVKNNSERSLKLNSFKLGEDTLNLSEELPPGSTTILTFSNPKINCIENKFSINKEDILFDYDQGSIENRLQYGLVGILGSCQ